MQYEYCQSELIIKILALTDVCKINVFFRNDLKTFKDENKEE